MSRIPLISYTNWAGPRLVIYTISSIRTSLAGLLHLPVKSRPSEQRFFYYRVEIFKDRQHHPKPDASSQQHGPVPNTQINYDITGAVVP